MKETFGPLVPVLIPVFVIMFAVVVTALIDLRKQTSTRGPKWMWVLIICFTSVIGPIAYFTIARKDE
jgi:uncharacterized membrane protein YoaK (UPF0700 family)